MEKYSDGYTGEKTDVSSTLLKVVNKIAQFFFPSTAAFVTMFMARDVFPTPGRAASKIRSEF